MQEPEAKKDGDADLIKKFNDGAGAPVPAGRNAVAGASSSSAGGDPQDMQSILRAIAEATQQVQNNGGQASGQSGPRVGLHHLLTPEVMLPLAGDAEARAELEKHLPEAHRGGAAASSSGGDELENTFRSPQLRQNMGLLSQAIYSENFPIISTMMGCPGLQISGDGSDLLEKLCRALENKHSGK